MNAPAVYRIAGFQPAPARHFRFAIAINVRGRDTDMVQFSQFLGDDEFFPGRIAIPDDQIFVREQNIRPLVPIYIRDRDTVANFDLRIEIDRAELWYWWFCGIEAS